MQQANIKAMTYGEGIIKVNAMILRILKVKDPDNKRLKQLLKQEPDFLEENMIKPVFAFGFPKDRTDELNRAQMELNMKISSRREIMERMGKQNIPELLEEIDEDAIEQGLLQARISQALHEMMGGSDEGDEEEEDKTPIPDEEDIDGEETPDNGENEE